MNWQEFDKEYRERKAKIVTMRAQIDEEEQRLLEWAQATGDGVFAECGTRAEWLDKQRKMR